MKRRVSSLRGAIRDLMKVLEEDHYFYTLLHDEKTDEYFLDVTCGQSAVFTIMIRLTGNEVAAL